MSNGILDIGEIESEKIDFTVFDNYIKLLKGIHGVVFLMTLPWLLLALGATTIAQVILYVSVGLMFGYPIVYFSQWNFIKNRIRYGQRVEAKSKRAYLIIAGIGIVISLVVIIFAIIGFIDTLNLLQSREEEMGEPFFSDHILLIISLIYFMQNSLQLIFYWMTVQKVRKYS